MASAQIILHKFNNVLHHHTFKDDNFGIDQFQDNLFSGKKKVKVEPIPGFPLAEIVP